MFIFSMLSAINSYLTVDKTINMLDSEILLRDVQTYWFWLTDCGTLGTVSHGTLTLDSSTSTVNSSTTLTCDVGYTVDGDASVGCLSNGSWSELPSCRLIGRPFEKNYQTPLFFYDNSRCLNLNILFHEIVHFQNAFCYEFVTDCGLNH